MFDYLKKFNNLILKENYPIGWIVTIGSGKVYLSIYRDVKNKWYIRIGTDMPERLDIKYDPRFSSEPWARAFGQEPYHCNEAVVSEEIVQLILNHCTRLSCLELFL
jgi:hypothetical protein